MENIFGPISIIILACGLYCFYAFFKMQKTGEPSDVIVITKGDANRACKDKKAFIAKVNPLVLMLASVTTVYGIIDVVNAYVTEITAVDQVAGIIFLAVLILYMVMIQKVKKEFYNI